MSEALPAPLQCRYHSTLSHYQKRTDTATLPPFRVLGHYVSQETEPRPPSLYIYYSRVLLPTTWGKGKGPVARVIECVEAHYEIQDVEFGKVYRWCPER